MVNSCAVTNKAVADLRRAVRRFNRDNPDAEIVITGCAAEVLAKELSDLFPDTEIIPQSNKAQLLARPLPMASEAPTVPEPESDDKRRFPEFTVDGSNRVRAVVKVQDGCSHRCTYCIVPDTRGTPVSRPPKDAVDEVERLFKAGWREVTLSGINLRQYGLGLSPRIDFWDLLSMMDDRLAPQWAGRARLRISSIDPGQLGDKAVKTLCSSRLVCPQLHLSLQSLSPKVLKDMGRSHYGPDDIFSFLDRMQEAWPVFGLGADLLVGFPGETDDDFAETLSHCENLPLSYAHVFPYSERPGTPAAKRSDSVPVETRKARAKQLRDLVARKKARFMERLAGLDELAVVVEGTHPTHGVCEYYADCRFEGDPRLDKRSLVRARPTQAGADHVSVVMKDKQ